MVLPIRQGPLHLVGIERDARTGPGSGFFPAALAGALAAVSTARCRVLGRKTLEESLYSPDPDEGEEPFHEIGDEIRNSTTVALHYFTDDGILDAICKSKAATEGREDVFMPIPCVMDRVEVKDELPERATRNEETLAHSSSPVAC